MHRSPNKDDGLYTGMAFIDLQKAFDMVDYTILIKKLNAIGVDDSAGSFSCMGIPVIKKVNYTLKFLHRKSSLFGTNVRKLLCAGDIWVRFLTSVQLLKITSHPVYC